MSWQEFDLFTLEASSFSSEVREVIEPLYETAHARFEEWEKEGEKELESDLSKAKSEVDEELAFQIRDYWAERIKQRKQVVGALALHYLCSTLKAKLRDLTWYFQKTHPASPGGYKGTNWLARLAQEYAQRFGVDFQRSPTPFSKINELLLARNAGIHWDGDALKEYLQKVTSPRFVEGGEFHVGREQFYEAVKDVESFIDWVVSELAGLRKPNAAADQNERTR